MAKTRTAQPCVSIKSNGFCFSVYHPEMTGARGGHYGWNRTEICWSISHAATGWNTGKRHAIDREELQKMNEAIAKAADTMQNFVDAPPVNEIRAIVFKITGSLLRPEPIQNAAEFRIVDAICGT
jgi:hypothetical protein